MNKKGIAGFEVVLMIMTTFAFAFIIAGATPSVVAETSMSEPSYCCEKTDAGAWCVNADEGECSDSFLSSPTSCETTSYCRTGTCYESEEGICMENTPQRVCNDYGGTWDAREIEEVPQCQLGCCIIADQAAFVPLVRCKRLSTLFGVENDYRRDITNEIQCIATAQAQDVGACVYESDFERVCEFTTRGECGAGERVDIVNGTNVTLSSQRTFYEDFLCSAEELNTACAKQVSTTCYQSDVYWVDSCGNRENVYSEDKAKSWNAGKVLEADGVCSPNDGSDIDCGNCDYFLGSRCAEFDGYLGGPKSGDNYCQKTECVDRNGDKRINGESWCVRGSASQVGSEQWAVGSGLDTVGSRYFRELCIDGEVNVEPCADFRNEVCLEGSIDTTAGDFGTAACRVNRWQDCVAQEDEDDCTNIDKRDCIWTPAVVGMVLGGQEQSGSKFSNPTSGSGGTFSNPTADGTFTGNVVAPITGDSIFGGDDEEEDTEETVTNRARGICVPNFPPGLNFWEESSAQQICGQANAKCVVVYEKGLLGGESCVEGRECEEESWALDANRVCAGLGDCGGYVNYRGVYTDDGYKWLDDGDEKNFAPNSVNIISGGFTGMVTGMVVGLITGRAIATDNPLGYYVSPKGNIVKMDAEGGFAATEGGGSWYADKSVADAAAAKLGGVDSSTLSPTKFAGGQAYLAEMLKLTPGSGFSAIVSGLQWAGIAYGAGYLVGGLIGLDKRNTQALSTALALGAFAYKAIASYSFPAGSGLTQAGGFIAQNPAIIGIGVGAIVFLMMYKTEDTKVVEFNCMPWQAPTGGDVCEECNDATLPCSEYRCRSLGQNCEIVNEGTEQEQCVNVNPGDVNPPIIKPNYEDLSSGHEYTNVKNSPPGPGFTIVNMEAGDGCLKAFTPLEFGVETDEPAQCKIDYRSTTSFDEMVTYVGGSNLFSYNHSEKFSLPSAAALKNSSLILENGKDLTFFLRCMDKNGNENEAEYAVRFCVDPTPDTTAPSVEATSIVNGGCVAEDQDTSEVRFYTNEPAECRWSPQDQDFDNMQGTMSCNSELYQSNAAQLFTCVAELTGISREDTKFYIRCSDKSEFANNMTESYEFSLRGSTGLKMKNLMPNETIFGAVSPSPVELYVETLFGCNEGRAICQYSESGVAGDYIQFFDTNTEDGIHTQRLDLTAGSHKYYVKCTDEGGNTVVDTAEFSLDIDSNAPVVARVYEENNLLKLVTVRDSECAYTFDNCDFSFAEGTEMPYANTTVHVTEWNQEKTYYIKCRDEFRNEDADCSVVVRPTRDLFN